MSSPHPVPERLVSLPGVRSGDPHMLPATGDRLRGFSGRRFVRAGPQSRWDNNGMTFQASQLIRTGQYILLAPASLSLALFLLRPELKEVTADVLRGLYFI